MITLDEQILICAVCYALGRQSYIVDVVAEYVWFKRKTLSEDCINVIVRDIEEEIEFCHRRGTTCGMECDERTWKNLHELLKKEGQQDGRKTTEKRQGMC